MLTPLSMLAALLPAIPTLQEPQQSVRVLRDPWGVPHVLADSDYGAGYGYGWALAEDRLEEALSAYWTVQGRRTEIEGEKAQPIDRTFRLLRLADHAQEALAGQPEMVREVAAGFAAGMNSYMAANPERVPPWAEPVHPAWPIALGRVIDYWNPLREANGEARRLAPRLAILTTGSDDSHYKTYGSNGWALAPSRTEAGHAMVACDPHLPWKHEFLLHEVHLKGASFEVAGAAFVGVPFPVFGRTRDTAWTWTANNPDVADVYRLELVEGDPSRYRFGDEELTFETEEVSYLLPSGEELSETLRWSVHGPVTHVDPAQGYAVAYWFSGFGETGGPEQLAKMCRAGDVEELDEAMSGLQFSYFNFIAADTSGQIEYVYAGRVPKSSASVDRGRPLDGSKPSALWDEFIPFAELPSVRDPEVGFVQSCNNRPENTTGTDADPTAESAAPGVVDGGRPDTVRAWYLRSRLAQDSEFTREEALSLLTDGTMIPHAPLSAQLRAAWDSHRDTYAHSDQVAADVELLLDWDGQPDLSSGAPTLFLLWAFEVNDQGAMLKVELLERDPAQLGREDALALLDALRAARKRLRKLVPFPPQVPWGLIHVIRKAGRVFPVATGMYPAISLMNANLDMSKPEMGSLTCRVGSAYLALHELSDPPLSWTVTPLGQTERADLPYVHACTELFAKRELKPLAWTEEQLQEVGATERVLTFSRTSVR